MTDQLKEALSTLDADTVNPFAKIVTLMKGMTNVVQWDSGTYTGVGVGPVVVTTQRPRAVIVYDETNDAIGFWHDGMDDASVYVVTSVPDAGLDAATGITPTATGFEIGLNANLNTDGDSGVWFVIS